MDKKCDLCVDASTSSLLYMYFHFWLISVLSFWALQASNINSEKTARKINVKVSFTFLFPASRGLVRWADEYGKKDASATLGRNSPC